MYIRQTLIVVANRKIKVSKIEQHSNHLHSVAFVSLLISSARGFVIKVLNELRLQSDLLAADECPHDRTSWPSLEELFRLPVGKAPDISWETVSTTTMSEF